MAFEYKRQISKGEKTNGNGAGSNGAGSDGAVSHDIVADAVEAVEAVETVKAMDAPAAPAALTPTDDPIGLLEPPRLDERVTRYVPPPRTPRDFGREQADKRAESQSDKSLRLRQHLDCEPPWDILRARASFEGPPSHHEPWPDRFDVWPADMAGYWPCPICDTPLAAVDRTPMKLFRCVACETQTFVHVKAPVVECPRHGRHEIVLPWANGVKWTYLGIEPAES